MLKTIREFAAERLDVSGEEVELRRRHFEYCLALAESANLTQESEGAQRHDLVLSEHDNIRAAIDWAADADRELAVRLAFALESFWMSHPFEGIRRLLLLSAAALRRGEFEQARLRAEESRRISERVGFKKGEARVLAMLGFIEFDEGHHRRGLELMEQGAALAGELGISTLQAETFRVLATRTRELGRRGDAARWARKALAIEHPIGERQ